MKAGRLIDKNLKSIFMKNSQQAMRSVSHPVIRYEDGKFYLAVFAFFYTKEEVANRAIPRPEYYGLADLETGELIATRKCKTKDFSNASFSRKYNISSAENAPKNSDDFLDETFVLLDNARQALQETGDPDVYMKPYKEYFERILQKIPKDYKRFYRDLSKPIKPDAKKEEISMPDIPSEDKKKNTAKKQPNIDPKEKERLEEEKRKNAIKQVLGEEAVAVQNENEPQNAPQEEKNTQEAQESTKEESPFFDLEDLDVTVAVPKEKIQMLLEETKKNKQAPQPKHDKEHKKSIVENAKSMIQSGIKQKENRKHSYTYKDLDWKPKDDFSILPQRYFSIIERIVDDIDFLTCDEKKLRFAHPRFCKKEDTIQGNAPWQMMQVKVLNTDMQEAHYKTNATNTIYTSCANKKQCIFHTCPYVMAAYLKYLQLTNPDELKRQRDLYQKNKENVDAEGHLSYTMTNSQNNYSKEELTEAYKFIDNGFINIAKKEGSTNIFVVSYVSSDTDGIPVKTVPGQQITSITSLQITKEELERGLSERGYLLRLNGKKTPDGIDVIIWTDYLVKSGQFQKYMNTTNANVMINDTEEDMKTISFTNTKKGRGGAS